MKYLKEYMQTRWETITYDQFAYKIYAKNIYLLSDIEIRELKEFFSEFRVRYKVLGASIKFHNDFGLVFSENDGTVFYSNEFFIHDGNKVDHCSIYDKDKSIERFTFYVESEMSNFYINRYDDEWYYVFSDEVLPGVGECFKCDELLGVKMFFKNLLLK